MKWQVGEKDPIESSALMLVVLFFGKKPQIYRTQGRSRGRAERRHERETKWEVTRLSPASGAEKFEV